MIPLTFEDRVAAARAIELVYYRNRLWPENNPGQKPAFATLMPAERVADLVDQYLKKSVLLEQRWGRTITAQDLQAEMERMALQSRNPKVLRELFAALNNNPHLIAECLARPALVDRIIRNQFAFDKDIHSRQRELAENIYVSADINSFAKTGEEYYHRVLLKKSNDFSIPGHGKGAMYLPEDEFSAERQQFPPNPGISELEETTNAFVIKATFGESDNHFSGGLIQIPKVDFALWLEEQPQPGNLETLGTGKGHFTLPENQPITNGVFDPDGPDQWDYLWYVPGARREHVAVWTGNEMIVWGGGTASGRLNNGGRLNPATSTWTPISMTNAPAGRLSFTGVWTGQELIVWGGQAEVLAANSGGRYNPFTDTWSATDTTTAPLGRMWHTAIWTGTKMLVWGGDTQAAAGRVNDGSLYDPETNAWTAINTTGAPSERSNHSAVWTGSQMIVWGGWGCSDPPTCSTTTYLNNGGRYDPVADSWSSISATNAPSARTEHPATWTGEEMYIWGGRFNPGTGDEGLNTGARYNPTSDTWIALPTTGAPNGRDLHTLVWTGAELLVWGGDIGSTTATNSGGKYDPTTNTWSSMSSTNAPSARNQHTAVWSGTEMIIWGGSLTDTGGRYHPGQDTWTATPMGDAATSAGTSYTLVWTGTEVIVWGGVGRAGGKFNPALDSWTPTSTSSAPSGRFDHSANWTGTHMVIWGGNDGSDEVNTGGRYEPTGDTWTATSTTGVPIARSRHTSIWSGTEVLVWGGYHNDGSDNWVNSGGRYNPGTDTWVAITTTGAPAGRSSHSSVWTGTEMIIWGGILNFTTDAGDGGRYNPGTNSWTSIPLAAEMQARRSHIAVWTGSQMLVWGGGFGSGVALDSGGLYTPGGGWTNTSLTNVPEERYLHTGVWTGQELLVWGGFSGPFTLRTNTGGRYNPTTDTWAAIPVLEELQARASMKSIWTGKAMMIWDGDPETRTGGLFYPNTVPRAVPGIFTGTVGGQNAAFNAGLGAPECTGQGTGCDSTTLLAGRDTLGPEQNAPNTLGGTCADGALGTYQSDESMERIAVDTGDGSRLAFGKPVEVTFDVWAYSSYQDDYLDVFLANDANSPVWVYQGTYQPLADGAQSITVPLVLGSGSTQAVRGQFRYQGNANVCEAGDFNDRDDLVFHVMGGITPGSFTLGSGSTLYFDASASTDGSNPFTNEYFHDFEDSIVAFEWDFNGDGDFSNQCSVLGVGVDRTGNQFSMVESELIVLGLGTPGIHPVWLRVIDEAGSAHCASVNLTVIDAEVPSVTLDSPNGGESLIEGGLFRLAWTADDNVELKEFTFEYCTDWNGASCTWTDAGITAGKDERSTIWTVPNGVSHTCRMRITAKDSSDNTATDESNSNFYIIQATTDAVETVILYSKNRIESAFTGESNTLEAKLIELKDNSKVNGVLLNLDNVPAVVSAFSTWDATPTDPALANAVTAAIQNYLYNSTDGQISKTYTNAKYLVIVGDDRQIPFRRMSDFTALFPENTYISSVNISSTVGSAIANNMYLTDDYLADYGGDGTIIGNNVIYLPDLSVGRLVETPDDMALTINRFIAQDGQIKLESPERILVTGRDAFTDSALEIRDAYDVDPSHIVDSLLDMAGENPAWTEANLTTQLFGTFHSLNNINGHADHFSFDASDGFLTTTEMLGQSSLPGSMLYAIGCHSGLTVAPGDPNDLDLPEFFMRKEMVSYIGNTGYGWGLRPGVGYSELLMKLMTEHILSQDIIALGDALSEAKRRYYLTDRRFDVFDEKVLMEATLFGLPMYSIVVNTPSGSFAGHDFSASDPEPVKTQKGIRVEKQEVVADEANSLPPGVTRLELNFVFRDPTVPLTDPNSVYKQVDTAEGSYFTLNGESTGETNETIQPRFMYDSQLSGTMLHGTLFVGGQFSEVTGFTPAVAVPVSNNEEDADPNNDSSPTASPKLTTFTPVGRTTTLYTQSATCTPTESTLSNLTVTSGEYRGSGVQRLFNQMEFASYYSTFCDVNPPTITDPGASAHTLTGLVADFSVQVTDVEASIHRVLVTWTDDQLSGANSTGTFQSLDLSHTGGTNDANQTSTWTGSLTLKRNIRYVLQAVDADGNVAQLLETGADQNAEGTSYGSQYSSWKVFTVSLPDGDNDGLPDAWESANGTNPGVDDAAADPDADGLTNLQEFDGDTHPTNQDTDGDGDNDGSEAGNGRDPLDGSDGHSLVINVSPSGNDIVIDWTADAVNTEGPYYVYRGTDPHMSPSDLIATKSLPGPATSHTDVDAMLGPTYYYWVTNVAITTPAPSVLFVTPSNGPQGGSTAIQIFGNDFVTGSTVTIGGNPCTSVVVASSSSITCSTPAGTAGAKDVTVTSPNQQFGTLSGGFTYDP